MAVKKCLSAGMFENQGGGGAGNFMLLCISKIMGEDSGGCCTLVITVSYAFRCQAPRL